MHDLFFDLFQANKAIPDFTFRMEHLCRISHFLFLKGEEHIRPGITTKELAAGFEKQLHAISDKTHMSHIHINVNEQAFHCLPGSRLIRSGDILTIDIVLSDGVVFSDGAWTYPVGEVSQTRYSLIEQAWRTSKAAVQAIKPDDPFNIMQHAVKRSLLIPEIRVFPKACGHGIGRKIHEDPEIPFVHTEKKSGIWNKGLICTIEPVVIYGNDNIIEYKDIGGITEKGADTAYFEHTIQVKENGAVCLNIPEINLMDCIDIFQGFN
jgi:methionyl aminopeptidase